MPRRTLASLAFLAAVAATPLAAQEDPVVQVPAPTGAAAPGFHWVLGGAFEYGGDLILTVIFTDGSEQDIYAGQGGTFGGGFEYRLASNPRLALGATIGFKFVMTADEDSDIMFSRVPIDLTAKWSLNEKWWAAGGLTHHTSIEFEGDGLLPDATLPSATGITAEIGWKFIGLKYTAIGYDNGGEDLDASSIGLTFRWVSRGKR